MSNKLLNVYINILFLNIFPAGPSLFSISIRLDKTSMELARGHKTVVVIEQHL